MTPRTLTVTIVVPTCDRAEPLRACLASLDSDAVGSTTVDAVVVVDNNRGAPVAEVPERVGRAPVQVLREPDPGASRARNRGLTAAAGEVVVFVDDDVTVTEGWLDALVAPFADADVVATVGPIVLECRPVRPPWLTTGLEPWFSALDLGAVTRPLGASEHGWSANLAARRAAAVAIGGFDVAIGPGQRAAFGEDEDFLDRLRDRGGHAVYAHRAMAHHQVGASRLRLTWLARRTFAQGRADVLHAGPVRRRPLRAARSLAGAVRWGVPLLVHGSRDPARRRGLAAEELALCAAKVGAAGAYLAKR